MDDRGRVLMQVQQALGGVKGLRKSVRVCVCVCLCGCGCAVGVGAAVLMVGSACAKLRVPCGCAAQQQPQLSGGALGRAPSAGAAATSAAPPALGSAPLAEAHLYSQGFGSRGVAEPCLLCQQWCAQHLHFMLHVDALPCRLQSTARLAGVAAHGRARCPSPCEDPMAAHRWRA